MSVTGTAYARLAAAFPGLRVTEGAPRSGGGWVGAAELATGGAALDAFAAQDTADLTREYGRAPRPHVAAALALHRYAWPACLLFTVPWFLHRRVPRLPVADVSFHRASGAMTVRTGTFACLPDDPAAGLPGAWTVPSEAALRDELRAAVAEHLAPLLDAFGPRMRRGPRALWAMATDEVTEGLHYVAGLMGQEERAVAELTELLPGDTAPYAGGAGFRAAPYAGNRGAPVGGCARDRLTCCLFYTVSPEQECVSCPRATASDRIGRRATAA
ncbi:(2Fe-2S)-binding protein [Streptomyces sp. NRRL F-5123]|uniref:(2Fe-2S)-binding protein n=1 Tax=Streptomyces sp. NRRL F-5123 TaxID=1463856 RepID=UPI0004E1ED21|nr:(2Fe-2S)-binding protein [Streptomyces sp. NRRL F-5123]